MPSSLETSLPEAATYALHPRVNALMVLKGDEVLEQIIEKRFNTEWEMLYEDCPWSTVFQSPGFVSTWYRHYHGVYQPLLVKNEAGGRLTGLLTLAIDESGLIVGAGANQAEYQVWLAPEEEAEAFMEKALTALRQLYPHQKISLKYVPAGTPLGWTSSDHWEKYCFRREVKQPLLVIDKEQIKRELKKKNRREKMNRLKRFGELRFERLKTYQDFSAVLDELTIQSDFRKGAMYNKCVFKEDAARKGFLLDLFRQGLLHTTVLKIDEAVIASNAGVTGKGWLHLQGINTHSPFYARHSPGILHFLMLGDLLAQEGSRVFDLTPGADPYKEALATEFITATEIMICGRKGKIYSNVKYKTTEYLKQQLQKAGIGLHALKNASRQAELFKQKAAILNSANWAAFLKPQSHGLSSNRKYKVYRITHTCPPATLSVKDICISRDNLGDLLLYKPKDTLTTRWEFLMEAMKRFELGQHCYTWSAEGCLLGCAWQGDAKSLQAYGLPSVELPASATSLYGFQASQRPDCFILAVAATTSQEAQDNYILLDANGKNLCISLPKHGIHLDEVS